MPRARKNLPVIPEFISVVKDINEAARSYRTKVKSGYKQIVTPMMPLVLHGFRRPENLFATDPFIKSDPRPIAFIRQVLSQVEEELRVYDINVRNMREIKAMMPRVQLFKRWASLLVTSATGEVFNKQKLVKLMSDHAYKLRRAIELEPSKMVVQYGRTRMLTVEDWLTKFVEPAISSLTDLKPGSFGFVVDFSVAGNINQFLGAFFAGLGKKSSVRRQIEAIMGEIGGQYVITPEGIMQPIKGGRMRAFPRGKLEAAANRIFESILIPAMQKLWEEVVNDFFLVEPTSVSRWFPNRPMSRKGLSNRPDSLRAMMLTGKVDLDFTQNEKGVVGKFWNFQTERAPYWPIVEYGYPGTITAKRGRFLTLKDPDPAWWRKVQWAFGLRRESTGLISRRSKETILHPMQTMKVRNVGEFYVTKQSRARIPLLMPSGERFGMSFHPSLFKPGATAPVLQSYYSGGKQKLKHITYSLTITPTKIRREKVKGQRASLFIERLVAMMAERQKILERSFFNAASAYLTVGEQVWHDIVWRFRQTHIPKLGGRIPRGSGESTGGSVF